MKPLTSQDLEETDDDSGALSWLGELHRMSAAISKRNLRSASSRPQIFYLLGWTSALDRFQVSICRGYDPESAEAWPDDLPLSSKLSTFVTEEDARILGRLSGTTLFLPHSPGRDSDTLRRMAETGRLCAVDGFIPLEPGDRRSANICLTDGEKPRASIEVKPSASLVIPLSPPCYVDLDAGLIGPLKVTEETSSNRKTRCSKLRTIRAEPTAALRLHTSDTQGNAAWRAYAPRNEMSGFDLAFPVFHYQEAEIRPCPYREFYTLPSRETVRIERDIEREKALMKLLEDAGLRRIPGHILHTFGNAPENAYGLESESAWSVFMRDHVPALERAGWKISLAEDFRHHALEIEVWEAELRESESGWFDLDMGIVVEGKRMPLAPLLAALFRRDSRWLDAILLRGIPEDEIIELELTSTRRVHVAAARLKPLAATLIDLFEGFKGGAALRISRFDAPRLEVLSDPGRWQFFGQKDIMALAEKISAAQKISPIETPAGFGLELRAYQKEGLAWLQFLREHNLSGILADDMGLGKTAQAFAHLLLEKETGRLDRPALVILPTSLIFNWKNEAVRFAPSLSILSLHGAERKTRFHEIPEYDIVLTSYPLLWRDADELTQYKYHLLILDEAQTVKNARSQSAEAVRRIEARHRLCLTGTPLENHLGELWSQFDFLLPGFLGNSQTFTRYWRTPIEKQGDIGRRNLLARRIRPFILRRRKEDVAYELPPKTVIVRKVELTGTQRDLYETVRSAMDARVREEIASKGLGGSQIIILDALLKLRQICCDPRLVQTTAAQRVKERAKLDLLMTILPEQVVEGRRVLLFSQFTRMLALIEAELGKAGIDYVKLTGATTDRENPVQRFQRGEAPVFLISLKAGGTGLNLTTADTVIHFDPWWNPAIENQATDRAHRIGQEKPVFVYKLVVSNSIEEKILALQERKAELVSGILSENPGGIALKFGKDDIAALLAPLP
ncbi:MAG: DEAD/DEAH box helicase [Candidatus Accumulibacter sp.]|nr:DEAD/DEAH box helicase [Accumulibacter sp.]